MDSDKIIIKGASEHNLKNIDLELPKGKLIVFTGISGSGKSSLAFDTIYAEAERRYLESLSSYARQFIGQMKKAKVEKIEGLTPAIAIDQKTISHNPRSTVGTICEIYDYLRLLFARIGWPFCPKCERPIEQLSLDEIVAKIYDLPRGGTVTIFAPVVRGRKGEYLTLLNDIYLKGYTKAVIDGKPVDLSKKVSLPRYKPHTIDVAVDKFSLTDQNLDRAFEAVEQAVGLAQGLVLVRCGKKEIFYNTKLACSQCGFSFPEIEPRLFSFNSPYGACPECAGLGTRAEVDPDLIIPDKKKTIAEGAILPWTWTPKNYYGALIAAVCEEYGISTHTRIKDLSKRDIDILLYGPEYPEKIRVKYYFHGRPRVFWTDFHGLFEHLKERLARTESEAVRSEIEKYVNLSPCSGCAGSRLKKEALSVKINKANIYNICQAPVEKALDFFEKLKLTKREKIIAERILKEIVARLQFLVNVGLGYLSLDRRADTLASGETQRIRLASQVGSGLSGVLYVLDEPTIGLHMKDIENLLNTLGALKKLGNTILVIEHDRATIEKADHLVDIGPGGGEYGGEIVAQGSIDAIIKAKDSLTGAYLSGKESIGVPEKRRKIKDKFLRVLGAREHNLKNINVSFPLGVFVCVTGVSGSGKSTLVHDILWRSLARRFWQAREKPGKFSEIKGAEYLRRVVLVDQSPIGRTPRSCPATYTGLFDPIRDLFSQTETSRVKGYSPGRFSFNVSGGRCETCSGQGWQKIEMQFLPDVYIPCEDCSGRRYLKETLEVAYKGKSIADVLEMQVSQALDFFKNIPPIKDILQVLYDIGLDYIHLGQPATTLSGGEAQRIKLARELVKGSQGKTLYILDEPTTGLHFHDIKKLLGVLNRLVERGDSVIVIEHQSDVICNSDWVIDLGPGGGEKGGNIVIQGTPEEIAKNPDSYTGQFLKKILKSSK